MKFKNKGRKIYKTKEKNYYGKSVAGKIVSGALSLLLLGGIGFLGYSAAEPIINYTKKQGDGDEIEAVTVSSVSVSDEATTVGITEDAVSEQIYAASLQPYELANASKLSSALENIAEKGNFEYVCIPLKVSGGAIYYDSHIYEAQMCGAVKSELSLDEITAAVKEAGFKPIAEISLLRDNLMPAMYPDAGYKTVADGSAWLDSDASSGGKPWLSPFSELAGVYLSSIAEEIASADFEQIICSDMVFPTFGASDAELLGEQITGADNYTALTTLADTIYSKITDCGASMMLEVSASDIISGNDDMLQHMMTGVSTVILNIDFDELESGVQTDSTLYEFKGDIAENAAKAIDMTEDKLSDYNVIVRFSGETKSISELEEAKDVISGYGYDTFIIG
jgi:hypothetical protein